MTGGNSSHRAMYHDTEKIEELLLDASGGCIWEISCQPSAVFSGLFNEHCRENISDNLNMKYNQAQHTPTSGCTNIFTMTKNHWLTWSDQKLPVI